MDTERLFVFCSYFSEGEYLEMEIPQRKIIKMDELPEGFFYFTDTHIVEGTCKLKEKEKENERVYSEKRNQVVLHCRYWERPTNREEEAKNPIGF